MARTDQFRKQHDGIVALVQEISKMLNAASVAANAQEFRLTLSKLAGLVKVHLAMEDKALYPSLVSSADPKVESTAKRFIDEMGGISQAFGDYNDKWTAKAMREQSDTFVRETKNLFGVLGRRIEKENNELYPMADNL
jgi:hemerythrin-like domain-containing protein